MKSTNPSVSKERKRKVDFELLFLHFSGADRQIDIIDCEKQATYKMSLEDYIEYFESFERNKIYNVLSLEVSNTK